MSISTYPISDDDAGKFFAAFDAARHSPHMNSTQIRAMLGLAVLNHLFDDYHPDQITDGMESFFTDIRVRVKALLAAPELTDG